MYRWDSMTPDNWKIVKDCFACGCRAMDRKDWDYAVEMFTRCVMLAPSDAMFQACLRGCQQKKDNGNANRD
jgi:hypothetical protein